MNPRLKAVLNHYLRVASGNDLLDETDFNLLDRAVGDCRVNLINLDIQEKYKFSQEDKRKLHDELNDIFYPLKTMEEKNDHQV